jgi:NAD(P)-dependent dehydrogenase (short-subunit alcohol dehydrogenase family)
VTVASSAHRWADGRIRFEDVNWSSDYDPRRAYAQSKPANLLFTRELQRRLTASGSPVRSLVAHPGWAATNLQSHAASPVMKAVMQLGNRFYGKDDKAGALPTLYAATQDLPGASYAGPDGRGEMQGGPTLVGRSATASDTAVARRPWTVSEELTGVSWPAEQPSASR